MRGPQELSYAPFPWDGSKDKGRQGMVKCSFLSSLQLIVFLLLSVFSSIYGLLCWKVSIVESSSRWEERARMEGPTPTQQQDQDRDNLVGGPGLTQAGGGATGSVEKGTTNGNSLENVSASSKSVQFPVVESQERDGDHRPSSRKKTRISPGREGRGSVRHHREQTNHVQHVPPPENFSRAEFRGPSLAGRRSLYRQEAGVGAGLQPAGGF